MFGMEPRYRVMVADDEEPEVLGLEKILGENLPELLVLPSARNGKELLEMAREFLPDILICDINMPCLGGLEALEKLREGGMNGKIVINTAYSEFEFARRALLLGASNYLVKPTEQKVFLGTMRKVIALLDEERGRRPWERAGRPERAACAEEAALPPLGVREEQAALLLSALREKERARGEEILGEIWQDWEGLSAPERQFLAVELLQWCSGKRVGSQIYSWQEVKQRLQEGEAGAGEILWQMLGRLEHLENGGSRVPYVLHTLAYIRGHFPENISLEDAAGQEGISPFYLSRLLTQNIHSSFVELLTSARLDAAINLVRRGVPLRKDIETRVGFSSPTYFYKVLKKNTGMTLGEIRDFAGRMSEPSGRE